jgi:hypothetical protein
MTQLWQCWLGEKYTFFFLTWKNWLIFHQKNTRSHHFVIILIFYQVSPPLNWKESKLFSNGTSKLNLEFTCTYAHMHICTYAHMYVLWQTPLLSSWTPMCDRDVVVCNWLILHLPQNVLKNRCIRTPHPTTNKMLFMKTGADVMITIFCDFSQFSAKKMAFFLNNNVMIYFFQKLDLFWVKNAIFCKIFRRKYFKNHNISPCSHRWLNFWLEILTRNDRCTMEKKE